MREHLLLDPQVGGVVTVPAGAWWTGACSLLGEGPETAMGHRDFVSKISSPTLGTQVQR